MGCSNKPLSDIEIEIEGIVNGESVTQVNKTNSNGTFTFNVISTDTEWRIRIVSGGVSYPKDYTFKTFQGDQESIHFEYLFDPTLLLNDGSSDEIVSSTTSFESPHMLCDDKRNCLFIKPYNDFFTNFTESHCFSSEVYQLDSHGNRVKGLVKNCFSMNYNYESASDPCLPYKVMLPDTSFLDSLGFKFEVVVKQACCAENGDCPDGDFENEISYFFEVDAIPENSVDYSFAVTFAVDNLNDNSDNSKDGVEKFSATVNGPALGPLSSALYKKSFSNNIFESIVYNLYEKECDNVGLDEILVCTDTLYMASPYIYYSFANFHTSDGEVYFSNNENYAGKCFKVECIANNKCGEAYSFSYFTIATINDLNNEMNPSDGKVLEIFPNPTNDYLHITTKNCKDNWHFSILNVSGNLEKLGKIDCHSLSIFVEDLNPGVYFLKIDEQPNKSYKFIRL